MAYVVINAISVPAGGGDELAKRFAARGSRGPTFGSRVPTWGTREPKVGQFAG